MVLRDLKKLVGIIAIGGICFSSLGGSYQFCLDDNTIDDSDCYGEPVWDGDIPTCDGACTEVKYDGPACGGTCTTPALWDCSHKTVNTKTKTRSRGCYLEGDTMLCHCEEEVYGGWSSTWTPVTCNSCN